ncbi:coenzyme F420-0:L-glutamate ligase [Clostridia bacterium OttesenSCG-928-O13]|nr:coenzyme F420-0:L-glutamate ligase [Clostridia bacterium OttesenSCG-928-O13]
MNGISVLPVLHMPQVKPGDDLAGLLATALGQSGLSPKAEDVLVVKSKIVSRAEGCLVAADEIVPSPFAQGVARLVGRPAAYVELALRQSRRIVKMAPGVLICQTHHGFVLANAGVDSTNTGGEGLYATLPENLDASARGIRMGLQQRLGAAPAVVISDTFGRAWRRGQTDLAIGLAGLDAFAETGDTDAEGQVLRYTKPALADEVAAAADLVCGKSRNIPAALVCGVCFAPAEGAATDLLFPPQQDLFL